MNSILKNHEITERLRAKMIDWMIEVLKIYKQKEQTIFKSIFIMDLFFIKCPEKIKNSQLHLIGTVCLMIASKNEEVINI